jgi:predicted house-cleaning noncanonical NTP pyrophosphatase (MazG superfamily)
MKITEKAVKTRVPNIPEKVNSSAVSPSSDAEFLKHLQDKFQDSVT